MCSSDYILKDVSLIYNNSGLKKNQSIFVEIVYRMDFLVWQKKWSHCQAIYSSLSNKITVLDRESTIETTLEKGSTYHGKE